jgi:hypothetical protein
MKKIVLALLILLGAALGSQAQNLTTVTATVTDSNNTAYALGTYNVNLVNTTNQQPLFGGNANFQQNYSGQTLDVSGNLTIVLPSVTVMTPSPGLQWQFNVCANPKQIAGIFPPPTALPCFSYTSTGTQVSGSSVSLSASLKAASVVIPSSGGNPAFSSITAGTNAAALVVGTE